MSLLLDTHALLWWLPGEPLDPVTADRVADRATPVVMSAASIWEAAIRRSLGKLRIDGSLAEATIESGFERLPGGFAHAEAAGALPLHHRDPFDRLLVAQAQLEGMTTVTRDPAFDAYEVPAHLDESDHVGQLTEKLRGPLEPAMGR